MSAHDLASVAAQLVTGLAGASSLFILAAGLTLIFGVTRIVNFAHGSLYMLGAYAAATVVDAVGADDGGYWLAVLAAVAVMAVVGAALERALLRRLYGAAELLQLTATFGIVLIVRDVALALWGAEDRLGPRVPGLAGAVPLFGYALPAYDLFLLCVAPVLLAALWWLLQRTRFGVVIRAATENREVASALGINERALFTAVFALGAGLAGLAGALQLPREPANLGMDLNVIAEAFVVVVVGGLGSVPGAFVAALLIGLAKALCIALGTVSVGGLAIEFPQLTLVIEFVVMAIVLAFRPYGLAGRPATVPATSTIPDQRVLVRAPRPAAWWVAIVAWVLALLLPLAPDQYLVVVGTDIAIAAVFVASLQFLMGPGGLTSFGHAAYFGLGAYAAAIALRHGWPMLSALAIAPMFTLLVALAFGALAVRLSGVYLAMLTLAFAQIAWSIVFQWDSVTGGSNGMFGLWPPEWLAGKAAYYVFVVVVAGALLGALAWLQQTPFGYALRGARDSALRASALGLPVAALQRAAFAIAGAVAGVAGALYAFAKGSISPETLAIPRSVDALVMVLLGGLHSLAGPLVGASVFTWLQDALARTTEYWRAGVGIVILLIVLVFPTGVAGAWQRVRWRGRAPVASS